MINSVRIAFAIVSLFFTFVHSAFSEDFRKDSLVVALDTQPLSIIPASTAGIVTTMIGTQIFAGLIRPVSNDDSPFEPYLAESWIISPDHQSITFTIRDNAFFHDGVALTIDDIAFSIQIAKKYHPYGPAFDLIKQVRVLDTTSLTVDFIHPVPEMLALFSPNFIPILPRHVYGDGVPLPQRPIDELPVGSGPFVMESITDQKLFRLSAFQQFFIPDHPFLSHLTFRIFENPDDIFFALKAGEVDLVGFSHAFIQNRKFSDIPDVITTTSGYDTLRAKAFLYFNMENDLFKNIKVRKALNYAVDSHFIREQLFQGGAIPLDGPLLSDSPFFTAGADVLYPVDIARANQLLDEAGYPRGHDGKRFKIHVDNLPNTRQLFIPMLEYLRHSLSRQIGVELTYTESTSLADWSERVATGDYEAATDFLFTWSEPIIGTHRTYHSKNIIEGRLWANMIQYHNPEVDKLLDLATKTVEDSERKKIYAKVQHLITSDAPAIWIGSIPYTTAYRAKNDSRLMGLEYGLWGLLSPFDHVCWQ